MANNKLGAVYATPNDTKDLSLNLPNVPSADSKVTDETAYLTALRSQITQLQDNVNSFLTQKMEDDNAASAATAQQGSATKAQHRKEQREDDMYGEEDAEDE